MKVQVCVVAVAALLVGAAPQEDTKDFMTYLYHRVTPEVCGVSLCWPEGKSCFMKIRIPEIKTEQQVPEIKANLTRCVGIIGAHKADFSALTLDDFQPKKSGPDDEGFEIGSFLKKFKVAKRHTFGMLECMLNESGEIPKVKACLAATQATTNPESGATTQAP